MHSIPNTPNGIVPNEFKFETKSDAIYNYIESSCLFSNLYSSALGFYSFVVVVVVVDTLKLIRNFGSLSFSFLHKMVIRLVEHGFKIIIETKRTNL